MKSLNIFLWVILTILALSCFSKLIWLKTGNFPSRNPSHEAWDVIIHFYLLVWTAILLSA